MAHLEMPSIPKRASSNASLQPDAIVPQTLTSPQLHAVFDILTHYETYAEVELFKQPETVTGYGYPFSLHQNPDSPPSYATKSSTPLLAALLRSMVLPLPGVRDLPSEFWHVRFQGILAKLSEADLSESYDKGVLGVRKTLATAASVIHESVSRGILGGVSKGPKRNLHGCYDRTNASELQRAWEDSVHEATYGTLIDDVFETAAGSSNLEDHPPAVLAAIDYIIVHVATFMHHVFVLSSEGPYMLKLVEMVHKMTPYSAIRQILRIGNVATMLNGLTRLLLAKMGMGSLSNWVGLTRNADDGMNLLQWIISGVLSADSTEFRKTTENVEKAKDGPPKELLVKIKEYILKPREVHEQARKTSLETPTSIIAVILGDSLNSISIEEHAQCLEYFSASLAMRDREEITKALCRQKPDHFTQAIRDVVTSFEPMIRRIHETVDLREHVYSIENLLTDFIDTSKPKKTPVRISDAPAGGGEGSAPVETRAPSIEEYVGLLTRARQLVYNLIHDVLEKCPEVGDQYRDYSKLVFKVLASGQTDVQLQAGEWEPSSSSESFVSAMEDIRIEVTSKTGDSKEIRLDEETDNAGPVSTGNHVTVTPWRQRKGAAGALSSNLQSLFAALPSETRAEIIAVVDAHVIYLTELEHLSHNRMQNILDDFQSTQPENTNPTTVSEPNSSSSSSSINNEQQSNPGNMDIIEGKSKGASISGPGMFLSRWQQLLDDTIVAPDVPGGQPRRGKDVKHALVQGKTVSAATKDAWDPEALTELVEKDVPSPPEGEKLVVKALGAGFKELMVDLVARLTV